MEKILSEEEKQRINALLEKHHPREGIQEKEMVVLSEKGKEKALKLKQYRVQWNLLRIDL